MKKLALLASVAIIAAGSVGTAEARHRHNRGGAIAAGLIGGALLGGLLTAAATPSYAYPAYGYGYSPYAAPAYGYRTTYSYGYGYPAAYPAYSYPAAYPAYGYGYYSAPVTRVVYRPAPVYRTRVVYRQPRVVYRQPRVATRVVYREPRYRTRVVYRNRDRPAYYRTTRGDVVVTGSLRRHNREMDRIRRWEDTRSSR
ncbi:hypothetical protein [Microvirga splendida]|uniref:Uncharacterized protein n=1 Tax=Microvirga splendida TaxID=2795727 RepID=A0ABS0Y5S1_9HYPH|nr:hypothetical protein [Microvirga splendida]MBJ6127637.1 hypothetical protein [Microvirga splendida]